MPGKEVNPGVDTNWVNMFLEYVVAVCETSRIDLILGLDATLDDYPELMEPIVPYETSSWFEILMREIVSAKYSCRLKADKAKVFGLMLGQMSEDKRMRVKGTNSGSIAIEEQNQRLLLSTILSTHSTDNRLGAEHNLFKIEQAFAGYMIDSGDSISIYQQRFCALLSRFQEACSRAKDECSEAAYCDIQLALKFTPGLNAPYGAYKQYHENRLKDWTATLPDAFVACGC